VQIPRNVCLFRKKFIHSFFFSYVLIHCSSSFIFRSIIHSAALKYSILHHLLFAVLRPVALAPDSFTYPRPLFHVPPVNTTAPPKEKDNTSTLSSSGAATANDGNRRNSGAFSSVNPSGGGTKRNSLRTQSTRFLGMVRGLLGGGGSGNNSGANYANKDNKDDKSAGEKERPQSGDMNRTIGSFSNYYHFLSPPVGNNDGGSNNPEYIRQQQLLSLEELASLNPSELKRIETRKKLLDCAFLLVNRLDEICPYFPIAIKKIILTIRDLIIITNHDANFHAGGSNISGSTGGGRDGYMNRQLPPLPPNITQNHMHSQATTNASTGIGTGEYVNEQDKINETIEEENKAEMYKNRRRFEYGTFFTSCSALLFLRLICRAIISPDDYGVMTNNPTLTLNTMNYTSNMDDASETSSVSPGGFSGKGEKEEEQGENAKNDHNLKDSKKAGNSSGDYPYRGLPAMYLIAATLAQFEKAKSGIAATSASPVPLPVDTSKKDPFPFSSSSSPSFASEIFQFARTVSSEIEYKDVSFQSLSTLFYSLSNFCFFVHFRQPNY
jgi:hypothetical protein